MSKLEDAATKYRKALAMEADLAGQIERHELHAKVLSGLHWDAAREREIAAWELTEIAKETP